MGYLGARNGIAEKALALYVPNFRAVLGFRYGSQRSSMVTPDHRARNNFITAGYGSTHTLRQAHTASGNENSFGNMLGQVQGYSPQDFLSRRIWNILPHSLRRKSHENTLILAFHVSEAADKKFLLLSQVF